MLRYPISIMPALKSLVSDLCIFCECLHYLIDNPIQSRLSYKNVLNANRGTSFSKLFETCVRLLNNLLLQNIILVLLMHVSEFYLSSLKDFGTSMRRSSGRRSGGRLLAMTLWPLFSSVFSCFFSPLCRNLFA